VKESTVIQGQLPHMPPPGGQTVRYVGKYTAKFLFIFLATPSIRFRVSMVRVSRVRVRVRARGRVRLIILVGQFQL